MILKLSTVVPVDALPEAVSAWAAILDAAPMLVDGDRWAQFDLGGARLALAGADRADSVVGMMAKVDDLDARHARLAAIGMAPGAIVTGLHERRFTLAAPGCGIVFYQPL